VIIFSLLLSISISAGIYLSIPYTRSIQVHYKRESMTGITEPEVLPERVARPFRRSNAVEPPYLTSQAILVMDLDTGEYLYEKNSKLQLWPASTTKLMTVVIALAEYNLDEVVTVASPILEGSAMGLVDGEQISVKALAQGALIQSANDAAYALARHHAGGMDRFVELMNQKAVDLGLENTHYFDPAGFDHEKQFTTVSDLAYLTKYALENKTIKEIVATPLIIVSDDSYTYFHQ
jgi:serine-type D-Ala-D-Ala carboxypeptidase (penicillin-binding protein 5/6)